MTKLNGPRYSDNDSGQEPSKEQDQRNIAAILMEKGIPLDEFTFKRMTGDNPDNADEMKEGIKAYGARLLGLATTDAAEETPEEAAEKPFEKPPLTAMPFADLAKLLDSKGINLQNQLDDHVALMVRRGIIQEQDIDAYREKLATMHVQKEELETIPEGCRPMLFVDNMTPVKAAERFIQGSGITLYNASGLAGFRKVDLKTKEPLKIQPPPSGLARLVFTPDTANLTSDLTGEKADDHLEKMQKGIRYLEPTQWFQLFAEGLEKAMKALNLGNGKAWKEMTAEEKQTILNDRRIDQYLPDANTWTQFPDWRDNVSGVLGLGWNPDDRDVVVGDDHPRIADGNLGPRPVFG